MFGFNVFVLLPTLGLVMINISFCIVMYYSNPHDGNIASIGCPPVCALTLYQSKIKDSPNTHNNNEVHIGGVGLQ